MTRILTTPDAERRHFVSIDSVPPFVSVDRPALTPIWFLAVFAAVSVPVLLAVPAVERPYATALGAILALIGDGGAASEVERFPLRLRPFFLSFFLAYAALAAGTRAARIRLALSLVPTYVVAVVVLDAALLRIAATATPFVLFGTHVVTGFAALALFARVVLAQAILPDDSPVVAARRTSWRPLVVLAAALVFSSLVSVAVGTYLPSGLDAARDVALLGGIGPGIVLLFPVLGAVLALAAMRNLRRGPSRPPTTLPSVALLVPAFNEERGIAACIASLERAAASYPGRCRLYVVDNGSTDGTAAVAGARVEACTGLPGVTLTCHAPGKARALNLGLRHVVEEVVVRVDADTTVEEDVLLRTVRYFSDPSVGAVGGMPLPRGGPHWLQRMRAIEVHAMHGFGRVGATAVDALLTIPGTFAAYRRSCLDALGGFAEGMNGEDTDVAVRIGRLGYRLLTDPGIRVYTEVPERWGHLREQRLRWYRSTFHVCSRNRSIIAMRQGVRGMVAVPWALLQAARRTMTIPVIAYAGLVTVVAPPALSLRGGVAVLAVIVGASFVVTAAVLAAYRQYRLLAHLPGYVVFRLIRAYLALEATFTLPYERRRQPRAIPERRANVRLTVVPPTPPGARAHGLLPPGARVTTRGAPPPANR